MKSQFQIAGLCILLMGQTFALQTDKREVHAVKVTTPPVIDGVVDDAVWQDVDIARDFYRFEPESGGPAPVQTDIRFLYDDEALYISAVCWEPEPGKILRQLGKRDDDDAVSDWIGVWISPFNDGANEVSFLVTAAGVQIDRKHAPNMEDDSWNPVWASEISLNEDNWSTEMAIPFSQLRFPSKALQVWGVNMVRYRALQREVYTWTELDKSQDNYAQQAGLLLGIKNIETPLRLSFTPYAAASIEHFPFNEQGKSNFSTLYRGGMDLKYGINESFTLDITLIPDFGQVQSDNEVLNLSPYELQYSENRSFFNEGTQLLHKAGLFYTRRVGSRPLRYWQVANEEILNPGDRINSNPDETQLINATKVTGQTVNGIGIGLFNAITAAAYAVIEDSLGNEREYLTNPASNYSLVVLGKNLGNGSDISLVNTNVQRFADSGTEKDFSDANVIGFEGRLVSKDSKWILSGNGGYDHLSYGDSTSTGYNYNISVSEAQGCFQYGFGNNIESEYYNPNDMGYLQQANEFSQYGYILLKTLDPVWKVNYADFSLNASYESLFHPRVYSNANMYGNYGVTLRNYFAFGGGFSWRFKEAHDFYEPRVENRYFTVPKAFDTHVWISSNYNKPLMIEMWMGTSTVTRRGAKWTGGAFSPRWRVNNQWLISYNLEMHYNRNSHGFADLDAADNPVFGKRDQVTITNNLYTSYIFSRNLESDLRLRYYRSSLKYKAFFDLAEDGNLVNRDFDGDLNTVFNAFTIDAVMIWRFAPGSEVNITWKNAIYTDGDDPDKSFYEDVRDLPRSDQSNSISIKLLYYIDWWRVQHRL